MLRSDIMHIQVNYHFDMYFPVGTGTSTKIQGIFHYYHIVKEVLEVPFHQWFSGRGREDWWCLSQTP